MTEAEAFLAKAEESLASAEDDHAKDRFNSCARNTYYAAFQAAVAALLLERIQPRGRWEHEFVHSQFAGILVYRRKLFGTAFRTLLIDAFERRADADYTEKLLKRQDVRPLLTQVTQLVPQVKERLYGSS